MAAGFTTLAIKDGAGASQNLAVYADAGGTLYPAPTGTDALGHILGLAATPIDSNLYVGGAAATFGQALSTASIPVTQAAPNIVAAASFARPPNTTTYVAGQTFANSVTAGSVVPMSFNICPANGIPIYILKARLITQTSGGAGVTTSFGVFKLHLYGQSPTVAAGDGTAFSTTLVNWAGTLDGTLGFQGTDYSVCEMAPTFGNSVMVIPAGGSTTIYGLLQIQAAFIPTNAQVTIVTLIGQ